MPALRVSAFRLAMRQFAWAPVLMALVAVGVTLFAREMSREVRLLDRAGVETKGQVTGLVHDRRINSDGSTTHTYRLSYRFHTADGETFRRSQTVSRELYSSKVRGDAITVRYVPDQPGINRVEDEESLLLRLALAGGSGLLFVMAFPLAWVIWARCTAKLRAARRGERRQAQVLGWEALEVSGNDRPFFRMQWRDPTGLTGETWPMEAAIADAFPAGTTITVHVDPVTGAAYWEREILRGPGCPP